MGDITKQGKLPKELHVLMPPGSGKSLKLGLYNLTIPVPNFRVSFRPNIADVMGVSIAPVYLTRDGNYLMVCHLHNYGSLPCIVTIRQTKHATQERG